MATRSRGQEGAAPSPDLKKQQEQDATKKWRQIAEQHRQDKEVEGRWEAKEHEKGKAKIQEEDIFQDTPEFEVPQPMPTQQDIDTMQLNSLLLASTVM